MEPVLRVRDLGKRYKFYSRPTDRLLEWMLPSAGIRHQEFWALRHVFFDLAPSECLGIIGPNGAGKSTLLKILANTLTPTEGSFTAADRSLAFLELGTGFHPELTGRDNIAYVTGLLGYDPHDLAEKTQAIIDFADLGEFIDHPVRTYSSGMFVRLAFSVYAGLEPGILIVDEALAVGDVGFQRRCLNRIEGLRDRRGTAVVLVTHDMTLLSQVCHRALVLHHGQMIFDGTPRDAIEVMHGLVFQQNEPPPRNLDDSIAYGDGSAEFLDVWIEDETGRRTDVVAVSSSMTFCYRVRFHTAVDQPVLGMRLATVQGIVLIGTNTHMFGRRTSMAHTGETWEVRWRLSPHLNPGHYFLSCGCSYADRDVFLCRKVDALRLTIVGHTRSGGLTDAVHDVSITPSVESGTPERSVTHG